MKPRKLSLNFDFTLPRFLFSSKTLLRRLARATRRHGFPAPCRRDRRSREFGGVDVGATRRWRERPTAMTRHGRARPGHPRRRTAAPKDGKPRILSPLLRNGISGAAWMAGTSPAMTAVRPFGNWRSRAEHARRAPQQEPALRRGLEPQRPPPFAVDLLAAKIPIETGCQGRAHSPSKDGRLSPPYARAASGG
jgi:hypothetical protein